MGCACKHGCYALDRLCDVCAVSLTDFLPLAKGIESREDYTGARLAQFSVPEEKLVEAVKKALLLPFTGLLRNSGIVIPC